MTEAELQRLAEIVTQISNGAGPVFDYWQVLVAFAAGVLVNSVTDAIRYRFNRRAVLRVSRASLYNHLIRYKTLLDLYEKLPETKTPHVLKNQTRLEIRRDTAWEDIRQNLISVDDRKYSQLIADALLFVPSYDHQVRGIDRILRKLERDELPLMWKLEIRHEDAVYRALVEESLETD